MNEEKEMVDLYVTGKLPDSVKVIMIPAVVTYFGALCLTGVSTPHVTIPGATREQIEVRKYEYGPDALWAGYGPASKTLVIADISNV